MMIPIFLTSFIDGSPQDLSGITYTSGTGNTL